MVIATASAVWLATPRTARASECDDVGVAVEGELLPAWATELARVCANLRSAPDIDRSAHLRVVAGEPVVVIVTLGDGRTAHRAVPAIDALERTIDALVTIPPTFDQAPSSAPKTPASASPPPLSASPSPPPGGQPATETRALSVELGLLGTGRVEGTPLYADVGLEGWAALNVSGWLLGITARFDGYETEPTLSPSNFEMMTFGGGVEFARRVMASRNVGVDVGGGLSVLEQMQSTSDAFGENAGEATDVRLTALTRAHFGRSARFSIAFEAELSPVRVGRDHKIDPSLPSLPAFGFGLGAGMSWQSL